MKEGIVIPTYRLKDVGHTVKEYSDNLSENGYPDVPITVFDDSSFEINSRDYSEFKATTLSASPKNLFYVGPYEKRECIARLVDKVGSKHEETIRRALRPSYGGNRNFSVLYTQGGQFISLDDDMRPWGLHHRDMKPLKGTEILRGEYVDKTDPTQVIERKDYDLIRAYAQVLGKSVGEVLKGGQFCSGETLEDSMADFLTNKTKGKLEPNVVSLREGALDPSMRIVTAQTFRSGSADVDATDYANDFLVDPHHAFVNDMSQRYVLHQFRPCITNTNWRLDSGVSGYDNREGLPPFLPTKLRFEDYIYRLWLQHPNFAAAHVGAVQTHYRNPYMRESIPHDLWNEEVANNLKLKLKAGIRDIKLQAVTFEKGIEITESEVEVMMENGLNYYRRTLQRAAEVINQPPLSTSLTAEKHANYLVGFARDLFEEFSGFKIVPFFERMRNVVTEEIDAIVRTTELWPDILEAAREMKLEGNLPITRVEL